MPVTLRESHEPEAAASDLINPTTGELTVEAQTLADFLTHVDFSAVSEMEGIDDLAQDVEVDNVDGVMEKTAVLDGGIAADLIDESDLQAMFEHYINAQAAEVFGDENATLEAKARLMPFADMLDEKYARGAFTKMQRKPAGHNKAARQFVAMLHKGVIKHVKKGTGQGKNKDYAKSKGYASGGTPAGKKAVALYKGKNQGKLKKAAVKAKVKLKAEGVEAFDVDSTPVFGLGLPIGSATYAVSLRDGADVVMSEARKARKGGTMKPPHHTGPGARNESGEPQGAVRTVREGATLAGQMLSLQESRPMLGGTPKA